ncbi:13328_t:CDS:1 [Cetraspora pellucida]|uniref:13328_t:CDS:1 n=1 Tax=Cetraspora pellucida TaxID=1433469 RepID=A0ACA9K1K1_9GLOM|nr:13328_t:CDS:1 [Cetraspora pellucida]
MPELMENILNHLNKDVYSLYSCALVSRHWCKISIPILWRDPFSFDEKSIFISNYFSSLDEEEKYMLKEFEIIFDFPNTLFHYASFLKILNLFSLEEKVKQWISLQFFNSQRNIDILKEDIVNLLFKLFVESGANLSKLEFYVSKFIIKPEVFYSLGQNMQFFSKLQDFVISTEESGSDLYVIDEDITLLKILAKKATKISTLSFDSFDYMCRPRLCSALVNIIKSQEHLKRFSLSCEEGLQSELHGVVSALKSQSESLQEICIHNCAYSNEFEVLMDCKKLEIFRILYCEEEEKLLKILNNDLCKISTLDISSYPIDASIILQILKKSGSLLKRLKLDSEDQEICSQSLLIETLMSSCPNLTYLYISYIELSSQLIKLIGNLQNLQFLTLLWIDDGSDEIAKTHVTRLAKILPSTLEYLDWGNVRSNSYLDILIDHCDAPLKKLLFSIDCDYEKTIQALIGFCVRKKSLNYVNLFKYVYGFRYVSGYHISTTVLNDLKKDLEGYAELVPYRHIVVDC